MSYRAIADAVGVDTATAYRKTQGVAFGTPENVTGKDGKQEDSHTKADSNAIQQHANTCVLCAF